MRSFRLLATLTLLILGAALFVVFGQPIVAQGTNLLFNPGFEGNYSAYIPNPGHALYGWQVSDCTPGYGGDPICGTAQMPANWWPWWISQTGSDPPWKNRMPEYKPAEAPFLNRVHGGARASQYFTFHGTHTAGHVQVVPVPANASLRFSVWGQAWSDAEDSGSSIFPTPMNMKIGIDPTGGTDPYNPAIVWSGSTSVYDAYALFTVEAQAQGASVSVWTFSAPDEARKHNDVYWDDATLEVIGAVAPPPPAGNSGGSGSGGNSGGNSSAPPPVAAAPAGPTSTPNANGEIIMIVGTGDSLWSIAAKAGITLDEILALNELTRDSFVNVGDELIVGYGEPEAAAPEEDEPEPEDEGQGEEGGEPEATPVPTAVPTAEPVPVAASAEAEGASICIKAFDDVNENGLHDAGEGLRSGVAFTVTSGDSVVSNYITTGEESEPFCITGLEAGTYRVSRSKTGLEVLTTPSDWAVSVADGQAQDLSFGSFDDASAEIAESTEASDADAADAELADGALTDAATASGGVSGGLIAVIVVIALLLLAAIIVAVVSARRTN